MIDLRSDTLTLPDLPMLETILSAKLGDDGRTDEFGRGEDPTVNKLEDLAADLTGKEAAVFVPTGTFGNSVAVMTYCKAGDSVLIDEQQHILLTEKFVFEKNYGQLIPIHYHHNNNHMPDPKEIDELICSSSAKLICLENSHNFSGGYCIDLPTMKAIQDVAKKHDVPIHMDGARLFHAATHLNVTADKICKYVDSVMFCVSKGLGAPVGSLVCGTKEFCKKLRVNRKLFGGVMRQAGVIAAPAIYALENNISRLHEDIENTKIVYDRLNGKLKKIKLHNEIQTNILMLDLSDTNTLASDFCKLAKQNGLLIRPILNESFVRLVFYKGITKQDAKTTAEIILNLDKKL